jgi:DNA-binding protein Fis
LREATPALASNDWESALAKEVDRLLVGDPGQVHEKLTHAFERVLINRALAHTGGRRIEAAQALGIGRNTITRKIQELGLDGGNGQRAKIAKDCIAAIIGDNGGVDCDDEAMDQSAFCRRPARSIRAACIPARRRLSSPFHARGAGRMQCRPVPCCSNAPPGRRVGFRAGRRPADCRARPTRPQLVVDARSQPDLLLALAFRGQTWRDSPACRWRSASRWRVRSSASGVGGVGLKWPNDILLDGGKVGGILVELEATPGACWR